MKRITGILIISKKKKIRIGVAEQNISSSSSDDENARE
jgi:hypothetical protein